MAYLRANLWQESLAGGSVAHTGGILAGLRAAGMQVDYFGATAFAPARAAGAKVHVVPAQELSWLRNLPDLTFLVYSRILADGHGLGSRCVPRISFINDTRS